MDVAAIADFLAESPICACLTPVERIAIASKVRPRHFSRDEIVFHRDDDAGQVFLIVAGTVKVSVPDDTGREVVIALERGGDVFGELALFDDAKRSATVTAITGTVALGLGRGQFMGVLEAKPDAMRPMLGRFAETG